MRFAFGAAATLYAQRKHPRVFFGADDLPVLRKRLKAGDGKVIADEWRKRTRESVREILAIEPAELTPHLKGASKPGYGGIGAAVNMGMLAALDDDADALEATLRVLTAAPGAEENPPWNGQSRHRLGRCMGSSLALAYDCIHAHLTPDARRTLCRWLYEHGARQTLDELRPHYFQAPGMNIPLGGLLHVVKMLLVLDGEEEVPDTADTWRTVLPMFEATLHTILGPNGYPEEDMGYGTSVAGHAAQVAEALRRAGRYDAYTACPRYAKFGDAMLHLVQPWGLHLSTTGDHGDDFGGRTFVLARQAAETRNPALLWLLGTLCYPSFPPIGDVTLGRDRRAEASVFALLVADRLKGGVHPAKLKPPPATAFHDPQRGIVTFRSDWRPDATFVVFDGSQRNPGAQGHAHASAGHFSLSALGEYFGIDTGRYNMEQNCHSVVLIDGRSGRSTEGEWTSMTHDGVLKHCAPGAWVDTAAVDSSLQHNCFWARRTLGLVKGRGAPAYVWVVDDLNKNNAWGEYWWQLHTCPENTIALHDTWATLTGWRHGHHLDVHFALPATEEYNPPHHLVGLSQDEVEPSSYKYVGPFDPQRVERLGRPANQVHYSTFRRPRLIAKIAGLNGRFMSLLLPRAKGTEPAQVTRLASLPGSLAVRIECEAVEDTLIFAHEHHVLEAGAVSARGQWCLVRRNRKSGTVLDYTVADGTRLAVDGKSLPTQA